MNNEIFICECKQCKYRWIPRKVIGKPAKCPSCQSRAWNKPDARTRKQLDDLNAMKSASKIR